MKIRKREKLSPIKMRPDDSIGLYCYGKLVLEEKIDRQLTINEALVFDVEAGDFEGAVDGIGGAFLTVEDESEEGEGK